MSTAKVAISIEKNILSQLDRLVSSQVFPNRSKAIQEAVKEKLSRINRSRLARECSKLNQNFEQALAEEGLSAEVTEWPKY
ncbi:MAG: ribbon-helix-helix domain-containing protein [Candidatus Auribacterota bacterium]|nr:ribbon-helix-helix domain-containing protein [Candidatus Auribacterota bacterium]